jgi:hypothetical protein
VFHSLPSSRHNIISVVEDVIDRLRRWFELFAKFNHVHKIKSPIGEVKKYKFQILTGVLYSFTQQCAKNDFLWLFSHSTLIFCYMMSWNMEMIIYWFVLFQLTREIVHSRELMAAAYTCSEYDMVKNVYLKLIKMIYRSQLKHNCVKRYNFNALQSESLFKDKLHLVGYKWMRTASSADEIQIWIHKHRKAIKNVRGRTES